MDPLKLKKNYRYLIGIDTGTKTGICVYGTIDKRIRHISTCKIHEAMKSVEYWEESNPGEVFVRVEDARKATYGRQDDFHKAQGAGSVKRDAKIWEDFLESLKIDFEMVRPNNKITKLNNETFKKITGYCERVSEHAMDAAMLVYGY